MTNPLPIPLFSFPTSTTFYPTINNKKIEFRCLPLYYMKSVGKKTRLAFSCCLPDGEGGCPPPPSFLYTYKPFHTQKKTFRRKTVFSHSVRVHFFWNLPSFFLIPNFYFQRFIPKKATTRERVFIEKREKELLKWNLWNGFFIPFYPFPSNVSLRK